MPVDRRVFAARAMALAAVSLLCALVVALTVSLAAPAPAVAKSAAQVSAELRANQERLRKAQEAIRRAEAVRKAALGDIAALDRRIEDLDSELAKVTARRDGAAQALAETRDELDRVTQELDETTERLAKTEADLVKAQRTLENRAVNIYKSGRLGYLEVLLNADRLSELITRMQLFTRVMQQDERVVEQIDTLRVRVTAQKTALRQQQSTVASLEEQQESKKAELDAVVEERAGRLADLDGARDDKQAVVAKAEKDKASWQRQEDALLAESDKLAADLRALGTTSRRTVQPEVRSTGQMIWPVNGRVSSRFGYRVHPIFKVRKMHTGIDLSAGMGTSIKAADGGTVVQAGWRGGYGKTVVISHGDGIATLYAHQSTILVSVGDTVGKGDVIGKVGSTGYSTGPHLHFEVRVNGSPVDPMRYL